MAKLDPFRLLKGPDLWVSDSTAVPRFFIYSVSEHSGLRPGFSSARSFSESPPLFYDTLCERVIGRYIPCPAFFPPDSLRRRSDQLDSCPPHPPPRPFSDDVFLRPTVPPFFFPFPLISLLFL